MITQEDFNAVKLFLTYHVQWILKKINLNHIRGPLYLIIMSE